jgi:hypothetical protein
VAPTFRSAVGLGALTVALLHDPMGARPAPAVWVLDAGASTRARFASAPWHAACVGVVDDRADIDETDDVRDRATFWRAIGFAFLVSALASAAFVAVSALVDHLDGAAS